jgi:hypothetical protein
MYLVIQQETENGPWTNYYTIDGPSEKKKEHLLAENQETEIWSAQTQGLLRHIRLPFPQTPLEQMIQRTPLTTIAPTPSSSTKQDVPPSHQQQEKAQHLPPLTTATTTSSLQPNIQRTQAEPSTQSFNSLTPELQKLIRHFNSSATTQDSYRLLYARVSEHSTNMDTELLP